jgi:hypothetical protein
MAKIGGEYPFVNEIRGVFERKKKGDTAIVSRMVYGNIVAAKVTYSDKEPTMGQIALQQRFATAARRASADMEDPDKKAEWKAVAEASHGKYKAARGAAFAAYYTDLGNQ